ncbi:MAG: class I SAM-dependent methyltransferase [Rhodoferax sp.]|uniref:class I SAM-dependent methyltransferase n=1 Tax=Rhodoferax sp. TaxID=50421 RepID=UPI00272FE478|nr:class I SAM-dependent methyltransferase [Rhodoferax sp.]MDP1531514.1 class I SAM-dependent methyltransferase [Rhodoferax sp.]MDP1942948.1 class I SAM-dependent methyltransferase [Rhodoferax sp.]
MRKEIVKKINSSITSIDCLFCGEKNASELIPYDRYGVNCSISICTKCGLIYTKKNIANKYLSSFYANDYRYLYNDTPKLTDNFIKKSGDIGYAKHRFSCISKFVGSQLNNVVEIGSGTGQFLLKLAEANVSNYVGLEPGVAYSEYLIEKDELRGHVIRKFWSEINDEIKFDSELIVLFHVFEHLDKPRDFLKWAHMMLSKREGLLIIEVPGFDTDLNPWRFGINEFHMAHRAYYSSKILVGMLNECGFSVEKIEKHEKEICANNLRIYARSTITIKNSFDSKSLSDSGSEAEARSKLLKYFFRYGSTAKIINFIKNGFDLPTVGRKSD